MPSGSSPTVQAATRAHPSMLIDGNGRAVPIMASGNTQVVTATGANEFLTAFSDSVKAIRIQAVGGSIRYVLSDGTVPAVAGPGSKQPFLAENGLVEEPLYADGGGIGGVNTPAGHSVLGIIAEVGSATVYVTELE